MAAAATPPPTTAPTVAGRSADSKMRLEVGDRIPPPPPPSASVVGLSPFPDEVIRPGGMEGARELLPRREVSCFVHIIIFLKVLFGKYN